MARGLIDRALRLGEGRKLKEYEKRGRGDQPLRARDGAARRRRDPRATPTSCASAPARTASRSTTCCPEAFALCREASKRTLGQRHYDVQLIGGMVLHSGAIAEMKTGEGKTLTATLRGVPQHARRRRRPRRHRQRLPRPPRRRVDEADLRRARRHGRRDPVGDATRRSGARCTRPTSPTAPTPSSASTTCATTWPSSLEECVQREHAFAIVDEVDNILIDEARTPLIISGRPEQAADLYYTFARLAKQMVGEEMKPKLKSLGESRDTSEAEHDYEYDEKHKTVAPTERGVDEGREVPRRREPLRLRARDARQPPDPVAEGGVAVQARQRLRGDRRRGEDHRRVHRPHPRGPALVGRACTRRSRRRRACAIREENQTLATITLQNYFRLYEKLTGMTGTALTEATEFMKIYEIAGGRDPDPPRRWSATTTTTRSTRPRTASGGGRQRDRASATRRGQPMLVGTISVEVSEMLSERAHRAGSSTRS